MTVVLDASVACKWFLRFRPDEDDLPQALTLLNRLATGNLEAAQPPHFYAEVAAVLAREKPETAKEDLADLLLLDFAVVETAEIYATALDLSVRLGHHLFDTLYHAAALQIPDAVLITADRRYFANARAEGRIQLLAELPEEN